MVDRYNPFPQDTLQSACWKKEQLVKLQEERTNIEMAAAMSSETAGKLMEGRTYITQLSMAEGLNKAYANNRARLAALPNASIYKLTPKEEDLYLQEVIKERLEIAHYAFRLAWRTVVGGIVAFGAMYGSVASSRDGITNPIESAYSTYTGIFNYTENCVPDSLGWRAAAAAVGAPVGGLASFGAFVGNGGTTLAIGAWNLAHNQTAENTFIPPRSQVPSPA